MRKVLLILCLAFFVLGFGWPSIMLPYSKYTYKSKDAEFSYTFQLNGKVKVESKYSGQDLTKNTYKYKLKFKNNEIEIIKSNNDVETIKIDSFYRLFKGEGDIEIKATNKVAIAISIGVGAVALLLIVFAPSKRY